MASNNRWGALSWFLLFLGVGLCVWLVSIGPDLWDALGTDMRNSLAEIKQGGGQ